MGSSIPQSGRSKTDWRHLGSLANLSGATAEIAGLSGFDEYEIVLEGLRPVEDVVQLNLRLSADDGVSFDASGGAYEYATVIHRGAAAGGWSNNWNANRVFLFDEIGNALAEECCGSIRLFDMNAARRTRAMISIVGGHASSQIRRVEGWGGATPLQAHNAVQLYWSNGNFQGGAIHAFGRSHS